MAYANSSYVAERAYGFVNAVEVLAERFAQYRQYRRTLAELSKLSAREMADIGFTGQTAQTAAHDVVYGAQR